MPKTFIKALILVVSLLATPYALLLLIGLPEKHNLTSPDKNRVITLYDAEGDPADDAWWKVEIREDGKPTRELGHCSLSRLCKYRLVKWLDNETVLVGIQFENETEITRKLRIDAKGIPCFNQWLRKARDKEITYRFNTHPTVIDSQALSNLFLLITILIVLGQNANDK